MKKPMRFLTSPINVLMIVLVAGMFVGSIPAYAGSAASSAMMQYEKGMIQLDDYPANKFGNFDTIRENIFRAHDDTMADRLLGQLLIIGKSAIPAEIKTTQVQVIEPSMGGSTTPTKEQP